MKLVWTVVLGLVALLALVVGLQAADNRGGNNDEVCLTGRLVCGKCTLHESDTCVNILQCKEGGKTVNYWLDDRANKEKYHKGICLPGSAEECTVTGIAREEEGKMHIRPIKVGVEQSAGKGGETAAPPSLGSGEPPAGQGGETPLAPPQGGVGPPVGKGGKTAVTPPKGGVGQPAGKGGETPLAPPQGGVGPPVGKGGETAVTPPLGGGEQSAGKGNEVSLMGRLVCGKCTLHESDTCANVLQCKEGGKTVNYWLDDRANKERYHKDICLPGSAEECSLTGTTSEKGGKTFVKPTKIGVFYK